MSNIITLAEAKNYLRIDITDDDTLVQTLCDAAEAHLYNATGLVFDSSYPLAHTVCLMLVASWYTNRENAQQLSIANTTVLNGLITQLAASYVITPTQVPSGLVVVGMVAYAWLRWSGNKAPDISGYNVYRDGVKVNTELVREDPHRFETPYFFDDWPFVDERFKQGRKAPPGVVQYRDDGVKSGETHSYQVSAVDNLGNESTLSTAMTVTVQ